MANIKVEEYENFLDCIPDLTYKDIEEQIGTVNYLRKKLKVPSAESNNIDIKLIDIFYGFVKENNKIPTLVEFARLWLKSLLKRYPYYRDHDAFKKGSLARASRAYPSIIRDLHFALYLKHIWKGKCEVVINLDLDAYYLIDILIIKDGKYYGLKLFTDTRRAIEFAEEKPFRNVVEFDDVNYIPLTIEIFDTKEEGKRVELKTNIDCVNKKYDDLFVYGEKHALELEMVMEEILSNKKNVA